MSVRELYEKERGLQAFQPGGVPENNYVEYLEEQLRWRDAQKEKPEEGVTVLILTQYGGLYIGYRLNRDWKYQAGALSIEFDNPVAYWMYVPRRPKEVTE